MQVRVDTPLVKPSLQVVGIQAGWPDGVLVRQKARTIHAVAGHNLSHDFVFTRLNLRYMRGCGIDSETQVDVFDALRSDSRSFRRPSLEWLIRV